MWNSFQKSFLNIQSNDFLSGEEILFLGHFDFNDLANVIEQSAQSFDEKASAYRHAVNIIDEEVEQIIHIITQNIDNLHERAGSNNILHLHGEIVKSRSTVNSDDIYPITGWELKMGDVCKAGYQLRPHIVWFGESVPMIEPAAKIVSEANIFVIIGTSLQVYPAAGLINNTKAATSLYVIDPKQITINNKRAHIIQDKAVTGVEQLVKLLIN